MGYPFTIEVSVAYELGDGGLSVSHDGYERRRRRPVRSLLASTRTSRRGPA